MRRLLIAIAGAAMLMAFAPAEASARAADEAAPLSQAASAEAAPCAAFDACGAASNMKSIGRRYASNHRRGRSFASYDCADCSVRVDVQRAARRYAMGRRRHGGGVGFACLPAALARDEGAPMWA